MEIVKKLNVPAAYFYNKVVESVLYDVHKSTGKQLNSKQLNNFEYIKDFSKSSKAKIRIESLVENESYAFKTSTTKNDFFAKYEIKRVNEDSCEIHYTEKMLSYGTLQKLNDAAVGIVLGFFKKRQFKKMLDSIEASY